MNCHSENMHLGDAIWTLTAMSRLRGPHVLCCNPVYHEQLRELVAGTDITIRDLSKIPVDSMDCWIASGLFESQGIRYQDQTDIMGFVQRYFNALGKEANLGDPFPTREDILCSWPSIRDYAQTQPFTGILVINADPKSGQCPGYSSSEMDALVERMYAAGHSVLAIEKAELSLVQIGALSVHAKLIVGCATGPWWPSLSKFNATTQRICMLHPMRLDYGSVPIVHAKNAAEVATIMEGMGFL